MYHDTVMRFNMFVSSEGCLSASCPIQKRTDSMCAVHASQLRSDDQIMSSLNPQKPLGRPGELPQAQSHSPPPQRPPAARRGTCCRACPHYAACHQCLLLGWHVPGTAGPEQQQLGLCQLPMTSQPQWAAGLPQDRLLECQLCRLI